MRKELKYRILSSIFLLPFCFFFIIKGKIIFDLFVFLLFLITAYEWNKMSKHKIYHLYGYFFLIISFLSIVALRNKFGNEGLYIFLFVTLICISTDIGGYIFGNFFKGPKITKISPKKTYAGMIGGVVLSYIVIYLFVNNNFVKSEIFEFKKIFLFLLIFIISITSQLGDIIVSYFKRKSNLKHTGKIIPGHGGLLDRVDGMIFAYPVSFLIFNLLII